MQKETKKLVTILAILILLVLITVAYLYFNRGGKENFTATEEPLDLLDKQKSNQVITDINTITCDGSSITKWSNKFYNLQNSALKPISLWKPKLPISNGRPMYKLGDMISFDNIFAPPSNPALFISGDVKSPTDYKVALDFRDIPFDPIFTQLDSYINTIEDLNKIITVMPNTISALSSINSLMQANKLNIAAALSKDVMDNVMVGVTNNLMSINSFISSSNSNDIIKPVSIESMLTIPAGFTITLYHINSANQRDNSKAPIILTFDTNSLQNNSVTSNKLSSKTIANSLSSHTYYGNVKGENIKIRNNDINIGEVAATQSMISDLTGKISAEIAAFKIAYPDLAKYLKLDQVIGAIQDLVTKSLAYNFSFPVLELNIKDISNLSFDLNRAQLGYVISPIDPTKIPRMINNTIQLQDIKQISATGDLPSIKILKNVELLGYLAVKISTNELGLFSFKVLEPIAPEGYVALGHIFVNQGDDMKVVKGNTCVGCVPLSCVKEVRDWRMSDMVFEYRTSKTYFNIFYNPYIGTFVVGTKQGIPDGKVCKVVACVKPCGIVDEIIKADKCARNIQQLNKSISKENPLVSTLATDEEDQYYLGKIAEQSQRIAMLKSKAAQMQVDADKVDVVNREYNRAKLQKFVDTQQRNIGLVTKELEKGRNSVQVDVRIPVEVVNYITKLIHESQNIPADVKKNMLDTIVNNKTLADSGVITGAMYKESMNKLLKTCQDYDLSGFVRKDIASQVCYGCSEPI